MNKKIMVVAATAVAGLAIASQLGDLIKVIGIGAAVQQFGPQLNSAINKLSGFRADTGIITKVVPIISGGLNSRKAVGAAQVMGPRNQVDRVKAVAQLDQDMFGREVKIRAMIPIESKEIVRDIRRVEGVGISGIVDLKL